jgi:hypothetical protein
VDAVTVAAEIEVTVAAAEIEVIVGVLVNAVNGPGLGNVVGTVVRNRRMANKTTKIITIKARDVVNRLCIGTYRHQALNTSLRCSIKLCKRPVKFRPTLLQTPHR